jgi:hypothetical protein
MAALTLPMITSYCKNAPEITDDWSETIVLPRWGTLTMLSPSMRALS